MPSIKKFESDHLDANENVFFGRELEKTKSKTYDIKFPQFKARSLIPVSHEIGPGATSFKYNQFDSTGIAKVVANYAKDFPRADIKGKEFVGNIKSLGASYGYSVQDIRSAQVANRPLKQMKASAARRAIFISEEEIAFFGLPSHNLQGLLSNPNIPSGSVPNDGSGSLTAFVSKSPDQIIRDLNSVVNEIVENTLEVEIPDTLLLPLSINNLISNTRITGINMTIKKFFLENNDYIKQIGTLNKLKEPVGGWGTKGLSFTGNIMLAYRRSPDALELEIPQDFEQFAVQQEKMDFVVTVHERIGGVSIYYPLSLNIKEGI